MQKNCLKLLNTITLFFRSAFLICPYGLPLLAAMLVGQLQRFRCWMLDAIYG